MNLDVKKFRTITFQKLLEMLSKDKNLNSWEKNFMNNILESDIFSLSHKQKATILRLTDKSRLIWNHKTLLKLSLEKF